MKPAEVISNQALSGIPLTENGRRQLNESLAELVPDWFLDLCERRNLAGSAFSLEEEHDRSEMGVELKWMTSKEMIDEAKEYYPGIAATKSGYLPFGICLEGSGDPYFLKIGKNCEDSAVVRIPHDIITNEEFDESCIELVASNIIEFFVNGETYETPSL
jgi:hypothetical protein